MAGAAILSVTLVPVLMLLFIRGKIPPRRRNPEPGADPAVPPDHHRVLEGRSPSSR